MGEFARRVKAAGWEERLEAQKTQLRQHIPLSEEEATSKALAILDKLRTLSNGLGYSLRAKQHAGGVSQLLHDPTPGVPGREVLIRLPALDNLEKSSNLFSALSSLAHPVVEPFRTSLEDLRTDAQKSLSEQLASGTRATTNPGTLPWFYPMAAMTLPTSFMQGHQRADKELDEKTNRDMDLKLEDARKQFEAALKAEYQARGQKSAACEMLDGVAFEYVKAADGELNQAAGIYLALASLLGGATHMVTKNWWEKNDPQQQRLNAMRDAIKRRIQRTPPSVLVAPEEHKLEETLPEIATA